MPDPFYPSIDFEFISKHLQESGKFEASIKVGSTTTFVLKGPQAIFKRTIYIRELEPGQVCYEQASGLAARFGFLTPLAQWYETNKNWKDGGFIVPTSNDK